MTTFATLSDAITTSIQTRIADPAGWLLEARRLCEAAGLSAARCVLMPATLTTVCHSIAREAFAQGEAAVARVEAALAEAPSTAPNVATMISALWVVYLRATLAERRPTATNQEQQILYKIRLIVTDRLSALGVAKSDCAIADGLMPEIRAEACSRLSLPNS